jgi:6-pyruvoyltetrahydropterin/6-carboxytetrahydropterin synthase
MHLPTLAQKLFHLAVELAAQVGFGGERFQHGNPNRERLRRITQSVAGKTLCDEPADSDGKGYAYNAAPNSDNNSAVMHTPSAQSLTTIEISKEDIKFSAAHFTIFSATERERLHGHNYAVHLAVTAPVGDDGICFSYRDIKTRLRQLCETLDEYTLVPQFSPHLRIDDDGEFFNVWFNGEKIPLRKSDTLLLPIRNSTVEEFARYLRDQFIGDGSFLTERGICSAVIKVSSGPGQSGSAKWHND